MKKYNLNPKLKEMSFGKLRVLNLGEKCRGRFESLIPFANNISEYDLVGLDKTRSGKSKVVKDKDSKDWLALISANGTYTRGTYGSVYVPTEYVENISVISHGYGAYGQAGRVGSWHEYLTLILENTLVWVKPSGGSHKVSRYWLWFGNDEVKKIEENEIELFYETMDIEPVDKDKLIDLIKIKNL